MFFLLTVAALLIAVQAHVIAEERASPTIIEGAHQSLIINGTEANRIIVPYVVAIYLNGRSLCGGSLISPRWVLTAGHCASGISTFSIHLGVSDIRNINELGRVIVETTQKIIHSGYNSLLLTNDIALINLGQDIPFTSYIHSVTLSSSSEDYEGTRGRVCGWIRQSNDSTTTSHPLKCTYVTIANNSVCQQNSGSVIVRSSTICTLGGACIDTSGVPLVNLDSGAQIGIKSFTSAGGCESDTSVIFTRVTSFIDWITSNTGITI